MSASPKYSPSAETRSGRKWLGSPLARAVFELKAAWTAVFIFSLVINVLLLAPTLYMIQVSDRVMTSRNYTTLVMLSLVVLMVLATMAALEWARARIMVSIGARLDNTLGVRLLATSHRFGIENIGDAGGRLLYDLASVRTFITGYGTIAALDAPWIPIFLVFTILLHPTLAMMVSAGALLMLGLTYFTERATRAPMEQASASAADASRFAAINMRHGEVIEAMGMLPAMVRKWQHKQGRQVVEQARAGDRAGKLSGISKFVRITNQSMAMGVGGMLFLQGEVSPGIIFAASLLAGRITQPVDQLLATWSQWANVSDSWLRLNDALTYSEKTYSGVSLPMPKGEVTLEGVFGGPPGDSAAFIQNINLRIAAGSSVAIVGSSASGKSSLLRLITGVWQPKMGAVRIDGADLRTWPRHELGPFLGYLPQDVELIEGTVAENIARLGSIDSPRVIEAAQAAGVHEMILGLKDGYGTQVGANGSFLSGGQRQRIALARAMYGNPPLLILDEPNANLDEAGEIALDKALQAASARGQTSLIVSHRPIAIRNCNLMLVMHAGQIAMYGPRDMVLAKLAAVAASSNDDSVSTDSGRAQSAAISTAPVTQS
jgi:ATP-binding cassette subfamily C exporter for protease/lipase